MGLWTLGCPGGCWSNCGGARLQRQGTKEFICSFERNWVPPWEELISGAAGAVASRIGNAGANERKHRKWRVSQAEVKSGSSDQHRFQ